MMDRLPFPHITATTPEGQVSQIREYLFQFKEELEFILMNLSEDNLSQGLVDKLNSLGADIEKNITDTEEQTQQLSNNMLTVSDVVNSPVFASAVKGMMPVFRVNFENGNLEY